jgi:DNA-binding NarL/FixJ family response regulator
MADAAVALAGAADGFALLELPFEAAQARLELAEVLAPSEPETAARAAQESLAAFQHLGAARYVERARRLLQQLGQRPPAPRGPRPAGPLSARELEVARLVADGLTAPQIAARLSLSPRTVTTHLDRIYTRLGIGSRAALVRYVTEAGLLPGDEIT